MENSEVLRQIAYKSDNATLALLSSIPPLWTLLKPILEQPYTWYVRTSEAFDLPSELAWPGSANENWLQIYNILERTRTGNPFSEPAATLSRNGYNVTAVKLLLSMGFDPSIDRSYALTGAAAYGSPEVLQILLNDKRVDPAQQEDAFGEAAGNGRLDNMRFLLSNERTRTVIDDESLWESAFRLAIINDEIEAAQLVLDEASKAEVILYEGGGDAGLYDMIRDALEYSNLKTLQYLVDEQYVETGDDDWIKYSIDQDRPEVFRLLLGREEPSEYLEYAAREGGEEIVALILEDQELSEKDVLTAVRVALQSQSYDALRVLVADSRAVGVADIIVTALNKRGFQLGEGSELLSIIADMRTLDLSRLPSWIRRRMIVEHGREIVKPSAELAGVSEDEVERVLEIDTGDDYNTYHLEMLLQELASRRLEYGYYLDWIIKHATRADTNAEAKDLIGRAATSVLGSPRSADAMLSTRPTVHTSPEFTAYAGFFLLANTKSATVEDVNVDDTRACLDTIRHERGVTRDGLRLAGMLLGALTPRI